MNMKLITINNSSKLFDYSRAFNAINISLLLRKLAFYGFVPFMVTQVHSYIRDRKQQVEIKKPNDTIITSNPLLLVRGVPQGSILGPLLVILYSVDIVKRIQQHCKFH